MYIRKEREKEKEKIGDDLGGTSERRFWTSQDIYMYKNDPNTEISSIIFSISLSTNLKAYLSSEIVTGDGGIHDYLPFLKIPRTEVFEHELGEGLHLRK